MYNYLKMCSWPGSSYIHNSYTATRRANTESGYYWYSLLICT